MPLSAPSPPPGSLPLDQALHDAEWCLFRVSRPNVLLIGRDIDIELAIVSITGWGGEEVGLWPEAEAHAFGSRPGTLVVRNVMNLDRREQARLNDWLAERGDEVRVIATSPQPLYDRVERREFLEPLYYRLNVVCLDAQDLG